MALQNDNLLIVETANERITRASKQAIPKQLFDEFWFEGETCFLISGTNTGKSILAMQIANSIASGNPINGFNMQAQQPVLYFDFELSGKQFQNRYSNNYENSYTFPEGLKIITLTENSEERSIERSIERIVRQNQASKVIIFDNITYILDSTNGKVAARFMRWLKEMKEDLGLTCLILGHTVKSVKPNQLISILDMAGSSNLSRFCDSAFAIGQSSSNVNERFIIQLKNRQGDKMYGSSHVCICDIIKPDNFTQFKLKGYGQEEDLIKKQRQENRIDEALLNKILAMKEGAKKKLSLRTVGKSLGVSHMKVERMLKSAGMIL